MVILLDNGTGSLTDVHVGISGASMKCISCNELDNELRIQFKSKDENDAGGGKVSVQGNFTQLVINASPTLRWEEVVKVIDKCAKLSTAKGETPSVSVVSTGPDPGD